MEDPVDIAIQKFKNYPSITSIKENIVPPEILGFHKINLGGILKEVKNLDRTKNGTFGDIPSTCLKSPNEIALYTSYISGTIKSLTGISSTLC